MANPLDSLFTSSGSTRLMAHLVAGDPDLNRSLDLALCLAGNGADLLEIQIPFSDPLADGPAIMASNRRALEQGVRPEDAFALIGRIREKARIPLLVMTYGNIPYRMGWDRFADRCVAAGACGAIIPDLPWDEPLPGLSRSLSRRGIHFIRLVSPGMSAERLVATVRMATGFLYLTLRVGTTGPAARLESRGLEFLQRVKAASRLPVAAGFGISSPEQAGLLKGQVDAVIVGSRLIELRESGGLEAVGAFIRRCREELDG